MDMSRVFVRLPWCDFYFEYIAKASDSSYKLLGLIYILYSQADSWLSKVSDIPLGIDKHLATLHIQSDLSSLVLSYHSVAYSQ